MYLTVRVIENEFDEIRDGTQAGDRFQQPLSQEKMLCVM
jgi:hypothetical protein